MARRRHHVDHRRVRQAGVAVVVDAVIVAAFAAYLLGTRATGNTI